MAELKKLACVEDDADIRSIVELALGDLGGFEIVLYSSGQEALAGLEENAPQLIILDVMMPGLDGFDTLKKLRAIPALKTTPVLFMTAKAQPREIVRYTAVGALGVITKPFDPISLADQVREFWAEAA